MKFNNFVFFINSAKHDSNFFFGGGGRGVRGLKRTLINDKIIFIFFLVNIVGGGVQGGQRLKKDWLWLMIRLYFFFSTVVMEGISLDFHNFIS